jgi:putative tricarboxylic transport membrane protein
MCSGQTAGVTHRRHPPAYPSWVVISIGSYALNNSRLDVFITVEFGTVRYWPRRMKYLLAPLVVALVLGHSTERALRQALITGRGDPPYFSSSALSAAIIALALVLILILRARTLLARHRAAAVVA